MTKKDLAALVVKLVALYYFLFYLQFAITTVVSAAFYKQPEYLLSSMPALIWIIFSIVLWILSYRIGDLIFKSGDTPLSVNATINKVDVQNIAFTIIGMLAIISSIQLLVNILSYKLVNTSAVEGFDVEATKQAQLITGLVKMAMGFWLLVGSKGIVNFINKLRGGKN